MESKYGKKKYHISYTIKSVDEIISITNVITVGFDYGKQLRIKDLLIFSWVEY